MKNTAFVVLATAVVVLVQWTFAWAASAQEIQTPIAEKPSAISQAVAVRTDVGRVGESIGRVTFAGVIALDGVTTHIVLARGGREALLPTQNLLVIDATLVGQAAFIDWAARKVRALGYPKAATVFQWSLIAVRGSIVASNIRQMRKGR